MQGVAMAGKRVSSMKLSEIQRFKALGLSDRKIAKALNCSRNTIRKALAGPEPDPVISPPPPAVGWSDFLDWPAIEADVARGVPLHVIWQEQREAGRLTVGYPAFWKQLRKRCPKLNATMHRVFKPGERAEVDYCDGIDVFDRFTGEFKRTQLFVGVLCNSRHVFAEFTWSQKSHDFLASHIRMFEYWGGVPAVVSPDNLKSAVSKTHWYDPDINPAYARLARHYGFAVVPARVRHPKDKAIVERTIQIFQRWFFFRVRSVRFESLEDLNTRLNQELAVFNQRQHRIFRRSRAEMFREELAHLIALPQEVYSIATAHEARLHTDCHLSFDHNFYSAPYGLRGKTLRVWATSTSVEIYDGLERVALHGRRTGTGKFATDTGHYPPSQQAYAETLPSSVREQARRIGVATADIVSDLLSGPTPLKYLRRAQGIIGLEKKYGAVRLEKACGLARSIGRTSCRYIDGILQRHCEEGVKEERPIHRGPNPHMRGIELFH